MTQTMLHAERETDVVLRSGASVHLRPLCPEDEPALLAFLEGLSPESRWFRFFSTGNDLGAAARSASSVAGAGDYGVVAVAGNGTILAHGMYAQEGPGIAEVAFAVSGTMQGEGIATTMLAHLAEAARAEGIE